MIFGASTEKMDTVTKKRKPRVDDAKPKRKKKGHGRNGADDYTGADKITVSHEMLKHKDPCPLCPKGKVYVYKQPKTLIRVTGTSPLSASVWRATS